MTDIPKTQLAAVVTQLGKEHEVLSDVPVKQPSELGPGEVLVKMEYSGVCHSDLSIRDGALPVEPKLPLIGGHEGVGRIVAIGEHTASSSVKIGDRVGLKWVAATCGKCESCWEGDDPICSDYKAHGFLVDGTFCQYAVSYADHVTPIPESLDSAAAVAILCAGLTVYKALKQANAVVGSWVAIPGAGGGLGHLAVQYANAMGFRVLAIDTGESKKALSLKNGAEKWIDFKASGENLVKDIMESTGGGPHVALVTASVPEPFNQAVMYLRKKGTLLVVGAPGNGFLHVPIVAILGKSLRIQGTLVGNRQDAIEALDLVARGKVRCEYEEKTLQDINSVFVDMQAGKLTGRVVLKI